MAGGTVPAATDLTSGGSKTNRNTKALSVAAFNAVKPKLIVETGKTAADVHFYRSGFAGVVQAPPNSSSEPLPGERKAFELTKVGGRQSTIEENVATSSTPTENEMKGNRTKEAYHSRPVEGILDGSAIRPGVAPGMKFGGSGSYPDLPWVSTTAPGPNGRTISGVTYRYDKNQIKIVCACHGLHMTPEEFVQHASTDHQNPETNTSLAPFSNGNPAASAQS